jgi:hypothetical protein
VLQEKELGGVGWYQRCGDSLDVWCWQGTGKVRYVILNGRWQFVASFVGSYQGLVVVAQIGPSPSCGRLESRTTTIPKGVQAI